MNQATVLKTGVDEWRSVVPIAAVIVALLTVFWGTATAMVGIWSRSDTFAHAFLVPPIVLWMVWRQRAKLATLPLKPVPSVLLVIGAACVLWLLGELANMNSVTQFALVSLLVLSVPAVCGSAVAWSLLFPLLFLYFSVPLGEFLVPIMMEGTADFTVAAVQFSGVPVYREGLQFVIPSGNWSVVEACSGVRYLIASFMVGTLFAYLNYRSMVRRAIFMVMSLVVPVVANWLRAYMIVMLGHLSGNTLAVGVDHLIYGWVFFGVVIGLMFMLGARWSEPDEQIQQMSGPPREPRATTAGSSKAWFVAGAVIVAALGTQAIAWRFDKTSSGQEVELKLPSHLGGGWQESPAAVTTWVPAFKGVRSSASRTYESAEHVAGVWAGYYRNQGYENKLVTSTNFLVAPNDANWGMVDGGMVQVTVGSTIYKLRSAVVRASANAGTTTAMRLLVWHVYWIGGHFTSSDAEAKLQLALNRLRGQGDDAAALMFFTPIGNDPALAAQTLQRIVAGLPEIERTLLAVQGQSATNH